MSAIRDFFLPSLIFLLVPDFSLLLFLTFALHYFSLHSFFICTLPTFLYSLCWFHFFLFTLFSSYRSFYPNFIFSEYVLSFVPPSSLSLVCFLTYASHKSFSPVSFPLSCHTTATCEWSYGVWLCSEDLIVIMRSYTLIWVCV